MMHPYLVALERSLNEPETRYITDDEATAILARTPSRQNRRYLARRIAKNNSSIEAEEIKAAKQRRRSPAPQQRQKPADKQRWPSNEDQRHDKYLNSHARRRRWERCGIAVPRPMTGFLAHLTPSQKAAALAYDGDDTLGDPRMVA